MAMLWRERGRGWRHPRQRHDAVVEKLLTGAVPAGRDDETEMQAFLDELRSLGQGPPPPPSAALSRMLGDAAAPSAAPRLRLVDDDELAATSAPGSWDPTREVAAAGGSRGRAWTTTAAVSKAAALILVVTTAATSAGAYLLPGGAQHMVTRAIESVTPFELDDDHGDRMRRQSTAGEEGNGDEASDPRAHGSGALVVEPPTATAGAPDGGAQVPPAVGPAQELGRRSVPPVVGGAATAPTASPPASTGAGARRKPAAGPAATTVPAAPPPSSSPTTLPSESAPPPLAGGRAYTVALSGDIDSGGRGDPDGSGQARVSLHSGKNLMCVALTTSGIAPVTSVHLHEVSPTAPDPVVATPPPDSSGSPSCVPLDPHVLRTVRKNPNGYYLEVHNAEFPDGALRGYLSK